MATSPYNRPHLASPVQSNSSESGGAGTGSHHDAPANIQRAYVDPFHGTYPSAPRLGPIDLPGSDSPMTMMMMPYGYYGSVSPNPGYHGSNSGTGSSSSSSNRSRPTSLPTEGTGLGIYAWGYPSPPISPQNSRDGVGSTTPNAIGGGANAPNVHPLLRTTAPLAFNILSPPASSSQSLHLRTTTGARVSEAELEDPATYPPCSRLCLSVLLYPSGPSPRRFIWDVQIVPSSRRSVDSASGGNTQTFLRLRDVLESLHLFVCEPVHDSELRRLPPQELQNARTTYTSRRASGHGLVRADFLYGCTHFAGIERNADNSFALKLVPPSTSASART